MALSTSDRLPSCTRRNRPSPVLGFGRLVGWSLLPIVLGALIACADSRPGDDAERTAVPDATKAELAAGQEAAADFLPRARPLTDRTFEVTPARLKRGRYLADGALMCVLCHSERKWNAPGAPPVEGKGAAGVVLWERNGHRMVAPNLTPDSATGAGTVSRPGR